MIKVITSQLTKHLTLVFAGNISAASIGFLTVLLISRELTVSEFGLFIMATSFMRVVSRLSYLGMNTTMLRFISLYLGSQKTDEATHVLKIMLFIRLITSFVLAAIIFATAQLISAKVFHYPNLKILLQIAAFGIILASMSNYFKFALYSYKSFNNSIILQFLVDISKFVTVVILIYFFGKINTIFAVVIFAFTPALGVLFGLGQFYSKLSSKTKPIRNIFNQLISYNKWSFASNICRLIFPYVGIFMLAKFLSSESAGIYGLALSLNSFFPIFIGSLRGVLLPEVSRYREIMQFKKYIKGSLRISLYMGIMVIPFMFFSHEIILFFFGLRYGASIPVFNWLLFGYIASTVNITIRVALYSINKPQVVAMVDLIKLIVMVFGCYFLIPFLGALAPAVLILILNMSDFVFLALYLFKQISSGDIGFQDEAVITDK